MPTSRRTFLLATGAGLAGVVALRSCGGTDQIGGGGDHGDRGGGEADTGGRVLPSKVKVEPFKVPLPVPPVLRPDRSDASSDHYTLVQHTAKAQIVPGHSTEIWGFNGTFPGPTIESRSGRRAVVHLRNELPRPTATHLHGGITPADSDGYPLDVVRPGAGRDYTYPLDQRAATLWYHDHRMDFTGPQVYMGLAGFHIVRDDEDDALPLPDGDREIPLMLADRSFGADGSLHYPSLDPSLRGRPGVLSDYADGVLGDTILVNGAPWPFLEVAAVRYRFRLLNASNARVYRLRLSPAPAGGGGFVQVGGDGGFLAAPVRHDTLAVAPGERFDVVIDFSKYRVGTEVTLANAAGSGGTSRVMRFRVVRGGRDDSSVPARLSDVEQLSAGQAVAHRQFTFKRGKVHGGHGFTINDKAFSPDTVLARPKLGTVELWEFRASATTHPVHIHLGHFQVLARKGGKPGPYDSGWKDTLDLDQGERARVLVRFTGHRGRYVLHCHNLEHEDMAMMGNFEVV
ncbi:multicopper oxidase family protein [Actinomadura rupiterrae]|uniref:multicopper oxidase family protein n=1 Tax=Actinomadura rupiterrae TaxID=559627 RepID=UPI0020A269F3|nr:multicopper oxidase family protein [Actinomadura rupiterrae]MCP2341094.1 spore coat protein A [Actinomadura rupiterrae]